MRNNELTYPSARRILREEVHAPRTAPEVDSAAVKKSATEHFSKHLIGAEVFSQADILQELADRARAEGLSHKDMDSVMAEVQRQISIRANFEARQDLVRSKEFAEGWFDKIQRGIRASVHEAGEHLGFGIARDVKARQTKLVDAEAGMKELLRSALEVQVMKHRMSEYTDLGGPEFTQAIHQYQNGQLKYNELLNHPDYLGGLRKIVEKINIDDTFVLEPGERPLDNAGDPDVQEAVRRHLIFVLRTEVVQLAEMQQLQVLSSEEYSAEPKTGWESIKKLGRVALGSGTTWGAVTRVGTKIVIGGSVALLAPGMAGVVGSLALGAGISMAAGAAAASVRERYEKKYRRKRHRLEAALGGVKTEIVKSAFELQRALHDQAEEVGRLAAEVQSGGASPEALKTATLTLYATVAEVQVRLLRSRIGEKTMAAPDHSKPGARQYLRLKHHVGQGGAHPPQGAKGRRPKPHGAGHGPTAPTPASVHTPPATQNQGPRQDYISFGVTNRFLAQQQLLRQFGAALMTVESAIEQQGSQAAAVRQEMEQAYQAAEENLNKSQKALDEIFVKQDKEYLTRARWIGAIGGGVAALAIDGVAHAFSSETLPVTLPTGQEHVTITQAESGLGATLHDDGVVDITQNGVVLSQTHLPKGVDVRTVHLDFWGDDVTLVDARNGAQLGLIDVTATPVLEGEQVLRQLVLETNLADKQPFIFTHAGQQFSLVVDTQGHMQLHQVVAGASEQPPVGAPFSVIDDTVRTNLAKLGQPLQFRAVYEHGQLIVKSAFDGQTAATISLDNTLAVTTPLTPTSAEGFLQKVINHPMVGQLLNNMGLASGDVKFDATTHSFAIPKEALHDVAGKVEYLGETNGWRATRMEFLLKAASEHRLNESPEMIMARAERATRHLLMEGAKYPNPQAAFDEAFSKDASFIQKHDLQWVTGVKADVRDDWMRVVTEMQKPELIGGGAPAAGSTETLVQPGVSINPLTAERLLAPVGSTQAVVEYLSPDTIIAKVGGVLERGEDFFSDHNYNAGIYLGLTAGTFTEMMGAGSRAPEIAKRYIQRPVEELLSGDEGYDEFDRAGVTIMLPHPILDSVGVASAKVKQERLDSTRTARTTAATREINTKIAGYEAVLPHFGDLRKIYDSLSSPDSITLEQVRQLATLSPETIMLARGVRDAKAVLATKVDDLDYQQIDQTKNGQKLKHWIEQHDIAADIPRLLDQKVGAMLSTTEADITRTRLFTDDAMQPKLRRDELMTVLLPRLALVSEVEKISNSSPISLPADAVLRLKRHQVESEDTIYNAVTVIDFNICMGLHEGVFGEVKQWFTKAGILTDSDPTLANPAKVYWLRQFMTEYLNQFSPNKAGLEQAGFLNSGKPKFGDNQRTRIQEVVFRLLDGDPNIFAYDPTRDVLRDDLAPEHVPERDAIYPTAPPEVLPGSASTPDVIVPDATASPGPAVTPAPARSSGTPRSARRREPTPAPKDPDAPVNADELP